VLTCNAPSRIQVCFHRIYLIHVYFAAIPTHPRSLYLVLREINVTMLCPFFILSWSQNSAKLTEIWPLLKGPPSVYVFVHLGVGRWRVPSQFGSFWFAWILGESYLHHPRSLTASLPLKNDGNRKTIRLPVGSRYIFYCPVGSRYVFRGYVS